jgi:hypothetical protein
MGAYMDRRQAQGDEYEARRRAQGEAYRKQMNTYADQKGDWERARQRAIGGAEALLENLFQDFGHTFRGTVASRWAKMLVIMAFLLGLIIVFQRRKDMV